MELEVLVRKAKRGDKEALLELMLLHKEYMYRTAFLYTKNQDLACDVVQECIMKSMVSISSLKKPEYFKSWRKAWTIWMRSRLRRILIPGNIRPGRRKGWRALTRRIIRGPSRRAG